MPLGPKTLSDGSHFYRAGHVATMISPLLIHFRHISTSCFLISFSAIIQAARRTSLLYQVSRAAKKRPGIATTMGRSKRHKTPLNAMLCRGRQGHGSFSRGQRDFKPHDIFLAERLSFQLRK